MRILAIEHEVDGVAEGASAPLLRAEAARAWELHQAGVVRELYFRADRSSAVLLLECTDAEEAGRHLATLPLVAAGLITFEVIPLRPYPGFARCSPSSRTAPPEARKRTTGSPAASRAASETRSATSPPGLVPGRPTTP